MMASYCVVIASLMLYSLRVILDVTYLNIPYFKLVIEMSHVLSMFISFAFFSQYFNETFHNEGTLLLHSDIKRIANLWKNAQFMLALSNLATPFHAILAFCLYYPNS